MTLRRELQQSAGGARRSVCNVEYVTPLFNRAFPVGPAPRRFAI